MRTRRHVLGSRVIGGVYTIRKSVVQIIYYVHTGENDAQRTLEPIGEASINLPKAFVFCLPMRIRTSTSRASCWHPGVPSRDTNTHIHTQLFSVFFLRDGNLTQHSHVCIRKNDVLQTTILHVYYGNGPRQELRIVGVPNLCVCVYNSIDWDDGRTACLTMLHSVFVCIIIYSALLRVGVPTLMLLLMVVLR